MLRRILYLLIGLAVSFCFVFSCCTPLFAAKPVKDKESPNIAILFPVEGETHYRPDALVYGTAEDDVGVATVRIIVNDSPPVAATLRDDGHFHALVTLAPGQNTLVAEACDMVGNVAAAVCNVDLTPNQVPLSIASPANGAEVSLGKVDVDGVKDPGIAAVALGPILADAKATSFLFYNFPLSEGVNTIRIRGVENYKSEAISTDMIRVICTGTEGGATLRADPPGGMPPFTTTLSVEEFLGEPVAYRQIDCEGNGTYVAMEGDGSYDCSYTSEGLYQPAVRSSTVSGVTVTSALQVPVHGPYETVLIIPAADPTGLAMDKNGRLFVVERGADRVRVYDHDGHLEGTLGPSGSTMVQLSQPTGIALDEDGNIYLTDTGNDRVHVFDASLTLVATWGASGSLKGQLSGPTGIAADWFDSLYVADTGNRRIQEYTVKGYCRAEWGAGELVEPWGVAALPGVRMIVSDRAGGALQPYGTYASREEQNWQKIPFATPAGIAYEPHEGGFLVADPGANILASFDGDGLLNRYLHGEDIGLVTPVAAIRDVTPAEEAYFVADPGVGAVLKIRKSVTQDSGILETWNRMTACLFGGDIAGAVSYYAEESAERYRMIFEDVRDQLGMIQEEMSGELIPVKIKDDRAVYAIIRNDDGRDMLFEITFVKDRFGQWKIETW